jgi:ATP-dependent RNA helicase SUPV3L1/SUV3
LPEVFYRAYGYHVCGPRAVRIDILERLADIIRPLLAWRVNADNPAMPPKGATGDGAFMATPEMMSLLGCSPEELSGVLKALGFRLERRPIKEAPSPAPAAPIEESAAPAQPAEDAAAASPPDAASLATPAQPEAGAQAGVPEALAEAKEPAFEEIWRPRRHARGEHRKEGAARSRRGAPAGEREKQPEKGAPAAQAANGNGERPPHAKEARGKERGDRGNERPERGREPNQRRGKGFDKRRHEERRKPEVHTAAPPRRVGIEADSPFAALGALRDALAKRSKESSST